MVPGAGLEPARHCCRGILSPLCLPISPPGLFFMPNERGVEVKAHSTAILLGELNRITVYFVREPFFLKLRLVLPEGEVAR